MQEANMAKHEMVKLAQQKFHFYNPYHHLIFSLKHGLDTPPAWQCYILSLALVHFKRPVSKRVQGLSRIRQRLIAFGTSSNNSPNCEEKKSASASAAAAAAAAALQIINIYGHAGSYAHIILMSWLIYSSSFKTDLVKHDFSS
jgi:hypothetical protein